MASIKMSPAQARALNEGLGTNLFSAKSTVTINPHKPGDETLEISFHEDSGVTHLTLTPTTIAMFHDCYVDPKGEILDDTCGSAGSGVAEPHHIDATKIRTFMAALDPSELKPANRSILTTHAAEIKRYKAIIRNGPAWLVQ